MRFITPSSVTNRTPVQMAKAAMKQAALAELHLVGLAPTANITVEYMGIKHSVVATPTVNVDNGQIMFHFGAVGANRLPFGNAKDVGTLSFGLGGNLMTGLQIEKHTQYLAQYGLSTQDAETDESLSAGETTR